MAATGGLVAGWGRAGASRAQVVRPRSRAELADLLEAAAPAGVVARGLGRAYGDAAQRAGGTVIDCTGLDRLLGFDVEGATVRVEGGCSLEALLRVIVPAGFFVPVTPGTRHVTVGGAIASDVHGKNHHLDGSMARHLRAVELATPTGMRSLSPGDGGELLDATTGGMGLTGIVAEATLDLLPIETASMLVDTERAADLEDCMARMVERDGDYRYSVAWVDCLARGRKLGRAVLSRGDHAPLDALSPKERAAPLTYTPRTLLDLESAPPLRLLSPSVGRAFNEAWFRKAPRHRIGELQGITPFFHPLDGVGGWNRLYGKAGFTQYQLVVPDGAEAVVRAALERLAATGVPCYLAVLKRFGDAGQGHLSFPMPGWTLALDLPLGLPGVAEALDGIDALVAAASGRIYLAKDGRLRPELLPVMYPRLAAWQAARSEVDPKGVLASDLGARLGLCA